MDSTVVIVEVYKYRKQIPSRQASDFWYVTDAKKKACSNRSILNVFKMLFYLQSESDLVMLQM